MDDQFDDIINSLLERMGFSEGKTLQDCDLYIARGDRRAEVRADLAEVFEEAKASDLQLQEFEAAGHRVEVDGFLLEFQEGRPYPEGITLALVPRWAKGLKKRMDTDLRWTVQGRSAE